MNRNILTKCVEELKKGNPDLSYLRGMLETLIETDIIPQTTGYVHNMPSFQPLMNMSSTNPAAPMPSDPMGAAEAALASVQGLPPIKAGVMEKNVILN